MNILASYGYESGNDLLVSLMPSVKYSASFLVISVASIGVFLEQYFGLSVASLIAFVVVMPVELISGVQASKEPFNSRKFSRFLFKLFYYLVIIYVTHTMAESFFSKDSNAVGSLFEWMNHILIVHIVGENIISITENIAAIEGKEKSFYITLIRKKINQSFGGDDKEENHE